MWQVPMVGRCLVWLWFPKQHGILPIRLDELGTREKKELGTIRERKEELKCK